MRILLDGFDPGRFLPPDRPPRILIVRLSALGDVVHVLPAASAIRRAFPGAGIAWLAEERAAGLPALCPAVDRVYTLERKALRSAASSPARWVEALRGARALVRDLRAARFDAVLDFQGNLRSALLARLSGARGRVGFARPRARERSHLLYGVRVEPRPAPAHRLEQNLDLLRGLGIDAAAPGFEPLRIPEGERAAARADLAARPRGGGAVALLHPGASAFGDFKRWDPARYGDLARALAERQGLSVLVTRGPGEEALAEATAKASGGAAAPAPETPTLARLAALLSEAALFVGGDTGPTHLAAAMGIPTVAVFGPKDPRVYGPRGPRVEVVRRRIPCGPCLKRFCDHISCLRALEAAPVLAAASRVLAGEAPPPAPVGWLADIRVGPLAGRLRADVDPAAFRGAVSALALGFARERPAGASPVPVPASPGISALEARFFRGSGEGGFAGDLERLARGLSDRGPVAILARGSGLSREGIVFYEV